jgi:spermidine/putrescine-binding protein
MMKSITRATLAAALLALSITACGTAAEPEPVPVPEPVAAEPPAVPTAESFPMSADFREEAETTITAETLDSQLAALEAEDTAEE